MKTPGIVLFFLLSLLNYEVYSQSVSIVAFGDWGRDGEYNQWETAERMRIYADNNKSDFILTLGDNFYPTGVTSTNDQKWITSFENIYTGYLTTIPWYITIGNHDYGGSVQAQIEYSNFSSRWKLPSRYYSFQQNVTDKVSILFIIIDTNPFIESYLTYNKDNEELNESSVFELKIQNTEKQLSWIDSVLENSAAKWKIVAGHHPVYSGGSHGNTPELIEKLEPILEKHKVNLYLAGHDHDMQHLFRSGKTVNYFVAGSGSKLRETGKTEYTLFCASSNGFLSLEVSNIKIKAEFIDMNGSVLYSTDIK